LRGYLIFMSHEVRAMARFPHRRELGLASALCGLLALLSLLGPPLLGTPAPLPAELPTPEQVQQVCLETAIWNRQGGRELMGSCARPPFGPDAPQAVLAFVQGLPDAPPALATIARLEDQLAAHAVANLYGEQLAMLRVPQEPPLGRKGAVMALLLGLTALALLLAWQAAQPMLVSISIGKIRLGPYTVDLERVASWDFQSGSPSLWLTDGTRVSLLTLHTLSPADRVELDEAMKVAMRRVEAAAPLDTRALRAVQKLAQ
jgi:hypothetical protein